MEEKDKEIQRIFFDDNGDLALNLRNDFKLDELVQGKLNGDFVISSDTLAKLIPLLNEKFVSLCTRKSWGGRYCDDENIYTFLDTNTAIKKLSEEIENYKVELDANKKSVKEYQEDLETLERNHKKEIEDLKVKNEKKLTEAVCDNERRLKKVFSWVNNLPSLVKKIYLKKDIRVIMNKYYR